MQMIQPMPGSQDATTGLPDQADPASGDSVTITKLPDGTFTVDEKPAKTIDEALALAREALTGNDGGMSVEKAFQDSFNGNTGSGAPGDMGQQRY